MSEKKLSVEPTEFEKFKCEDKLKEIVLYEASEAGLLGHKDVYLEQIYAFYDSMMEFHKLIDGKILTEDALEQEYYVFRHKRDMREKQYRRVCSETNECECEKMSDIRHSSELPRAALTISIIALALALLGLMLFFI